MTGYLNVAFVSKTSAEEESILVSLFKNMYYYSDSPV